MNRHSGVLSKKTGVNLTPSGGIYHAYLTGNDEAPQRNPYALTDRRKAALQGIRFDLRLHGRRAGFRGFL
jgi:hypothetical protein